jgi:hypothetical protein
MMEASGEDQLNELAGLLQSVASMLRATIGRRKIAEQEREASCIRVYQMIFPIRDEAQAQLSSLPMHGWTV